MRYKFYREHKYVSFALSELERLIARTDFRSPTQVEKIGEEFASLAQILEGHAHYENERLHELLRKKGSKIHLDIEGDHEQQNDLLQQLESLLKKLLEPQEEEQQIEWGYQFYLSYRKFVADNLTHLHEEETIILPELQRLYTDEELREVEFQTYQLMTPEQMVDMMEILFPHINPTDRKAFLTDIKACQPEKFSTAWSQIQSKIPLEEQGELTNLLLLQQ